MLRNKILIFKIKSKYNIMSVINNTKTKFIIKDSHNNIPEYWKMNNKKYNLIDDETSLLTPAINTKDKMQIKLKDNINPTDYNLLYYNQSELIDDKTHFYYTNIDKSAGKGFGNLSISTDIRNGNNTRYDNKEFKEKKEEQLFFDYQFNYLDKNFQDPNNVVLPFPRGGETTRKQNQLFNNENKKNMFNINNLQNENKIIFNY